MNTANLPPVVEYEFTKEQNSGIGSLAIVMIISSLISVGGSFLQGNWLMLIISVIVAVVTIRSAMAFRRIVTTEGNDTLNLTDALNNLRQAFTVQKFLLILALVGVVILLVVAVTAGPREAMQMVLKR